MPTSRFITLTLLVAAMAACQPDKKPQARLQDALPYLPLPPDPEFVSKSGSEDAIQVVMNTRLGVDSTVGIYRIMLGKKPWTLTADQPAADGGRMLLATRDGHPPLWIMIGPNPAGSGSRVTINGAVMPPTAGPASRTPALPADTGKKAATPAPTPKAH